MYTDRECRCMCECECVCMALSVFYTFDNDNDEMLHSNGLGQSTLMRLASTWSCPLISDQASVPVFSPLLLLYLIFIIVFYDGPCVVLLFSLARSMLFMTFYCVATQMWHDHKDEVYGKRSHCAASEKEKKKQNQGIKYNKLLWQERKRLFIALIYLW